MDETIPGGFSANADGSLRLDAAANAGALVPYLTGGVFNATISDVSYTGSLDGLRVYKDGFAIERTSNGEVAASIGESIFLSTGGGPGDVNTTAGFTEILSQPGDDDLDAAAQAAFSGAGTTNDASVLEFSVTVSNPNVKGVSFDVLFGSDEYPEYSDSSFVDIAAVLVNGVNVAVFNNNVEQPLSVISENLESGNFIDNDFDFSTGDGAFRVEYDGFSPRLSLIAPVKQGVNTFKIGIADTGDSILDSGLFIGNLRTTASGAGGVFVPVNGGDENDDLQGSASPEIFEAGGGDDTIAPGLGLDVIATGLGADLIEGSLADLDGDTITDFFDSDTLAFLGALFGLANLTFTLADNTLSVDVDGDGQAEASITLEGDFEDATFSVNTADGSTFVTASGVANPFVGAPGSFETPTQTGTEGPDRLTGTPQEDVILALGGNDTVKGLADADAIDLGAGDDIVLSSGGNDTVLGGDGDDTIKSGAGDDSIDGGAGNDVILSGDGNDTILGGDGNDVIKPGRGNDVMDGGAGDDILVGFRGDEVLVGGAGNDTLLGNLDDDTITGGAGDDRLQGGPGRDVFVFDTPEWGDDRIVLDFLPQSDTLDFRGSGLALADLSITQVGDNVLIEAGDSSILVNSARFGALDVADFAGDVLLFG
ncbi:choice-of-anchor L domain-containing protein [Rubrimonas cliftonensis]|uniref:Hemolysin-type calcium-binding repeat-containing protein n=1 Tax=Rubrimonas cliftonensis TaxID=89524 RepID=A0A1H4CSQ0_9RHOB|nr:choice-of-anchor L domain-containing protein [Rubrimonas cliftonensis]SEA63328.1 Hemolysin-type calcium-binding repeat-containing protein [Rubrimonas cliftonensis]